MLKALIRERLCAVPDTVFKILVTHHPFIPPPTDVEAGIDLVGRAALALQTIEECCVHLLLAGHLHHGYTGDVRAYHPLTQRSIIVAQAGTACSHRVRNEPNAYNRIFIEPNRLRIVARVWDGAGFQDRKKVTYARQDENWVPARQK